jgi:hypothetical protein
MKVYGEADVQINIFLISALVGGDRSAPRHGCFTPQRKSLRYPLDRRPGGAPESVWATWKREKSRPYWDSDSELSPIQPVASRYTYCAIPDLNSQFYTVEFNIKRS